MEIEKTNKNFDKEGNSLQKNENNNETMNIKLEKDSFFNNAFNELDVNIFNNEEKNGEYNELNLKSNIKNEDAVSFYLHSISKYNLISEEETISLVNRIQNGEEEALNKLIHANLRLAFKIAKNFTNFSNLPLEDLIQVANNGLFYSCKTYTLDKGCKFSTFAYKNINGYLWKFVNKNNSNASISIREITKINDIKKSFYKLKNQLKRDPTKEEICKDLNNKYSLKQIENTNFQNIDFFEIDKSFDDGNLIADCISNPNDESVVDFVNYTMDVNFIRVQLNALSEKEKYIIIRYFGLDDNDSETLENIGKDLGWSKERVRQVKNAVLNKIKEKWEELN